MRRVRIALALGLGLALAVPAVVAQRGAAKPQTQPSTRTQQQPQEQQPAGGQAPSGASLAFSGAPSIQEIQAQQRACEARKPPRKAKGTISESTYKRMERIIDAIGKGEYAESEKKLAELNESARGDYEKAIVLQTLGFVYASQNKEAQAIKTFEGALATNALPQQVHEQMMFNIAQLYIADDKWDKGMEQLNAYLAESCNPIPDAHVLLASVYAEKKRFRDSLKQVDLALVKAKTPREPWLQLKLALHYELKEFPRCAEVLVHLVAMVPTKEDYWKQLSGILFEVRKDPDALAVLALAERRGYINEETEYRNLSNMYMFLQIPLKAAGVLQRGIDQKQVPGTEKNWESLANAWLLAREYDKAEAAMKHAAAASEKGELYKRLGQIQIENENWKEALASLQKAQQKGGLKEPGETAFLIGVCAVELKQWKTADAALRKAMEFEKTSKIAGEWLNHLQAEYAFYNPPEAEKPETPEGENTTPPPETSTN
jgi:tetratricopeptide (TPR) repeat protein